MYHGFCNKGGCHVDAKNGPHLTTIPRAQETGHLKVVTRAHVTSIDTDNNGRVTGVTYVTDGQEFFQPAKVVLLSSYTYENSRLLLLSKSKAFPNGLSNNHGQVGRHYMLSRTCENGPDARNCRPEKKCRLCADSFVSGSIVSHDAACKASKVAFGAKQPSSEARSG